MTDLPYAVDTPVEVNADSVYDVAWMETVERRFDALGLEVVTKRGLSYAFCYVSAKDAIEKGMAVALLDAGALAVVPAASDVLGAGGILLGVAVEAVAKGSVACIAVAGVLPSTVTGLSFTTPLTGWGFDYVRANSDGYLELVAYPDPSDGVLGTIRSDGTMVLDIRPPTPKQAGITIGATSTALQVATIPDASIVHGLVHIVANETSSVDVTNGYSVAFTATRVHDVAACRLVAQTALVAHEDAGTTYAVTLSALGSDIIATCTGQAGKTVSWTCTTEIKRVVHK